MTVLFTLFAETFDSQGTAVTFPNFPKDLHGDPGTFLDEVRLLDLRGSIKTTLARHGRLLDWGHEANARGGRFRLFFSVNTMAFRTFCLICHDWLTAEFPFSESIVGVRASLNNGSCVWVCEIWVRDGFCAAAVAPRWNAVLSWLSGRTGIREELAVALQMDFRLHPTYRKSGPVPRVVQKEAAEIPAFASCIDRASGRAAPAGNPPLVFDLAVARTFKRRWPERRLAREAVS
jgi:hypothetical protein